MTSGHKRTIGICERRGDHVGQEAGPRDRGHRDEAGQGQWCADVRIMEQRLRSERLAFSAPTASEARKANKIRS